ncbi:hypothetical protein R4Z10_13855 [Niallia sp. XMNu-256]|uniref:TraR/DksA family transcriptional regulator n=1 Tax=Niallia sp. XMNu-256 TaxID=3082444 RepID=UPI0030CF591B
MDQQYIEIYSELRKTRQELIEKIHSCSPIVKPFIEEELQDVETALMKLEKGTYGTCEISGELIPSELLLVVPTLKSMEDCKTLQFIMNQTTI